MIIQCLFILLMLCEATIQETKNTSVSHEVNVTTGDKNVTTTTDGIFEEANVTTSRDGVLDVTNVTISAIEADEITNDSRIIVPCRNDTEWTCEDGGCISSDGLCNGLVECDDGSDEYRSTCKHFDYPTGRSIFALLLHCTSFWTEFHNKTCPEICQHEPEFCYYALLAENGQSGTCEFPNYPEHGVYMVEPMPSGPPEKPDFRLKYDCTYTYVLVEKARLGCVNGTWQNETATRFCSEACRINKREKFKYFCPGDSSDNVLCGDFVAVNTSMTVKRTEPTKVGNKTYDVAVTIDCMAKNKEFNITTDCVGVIEQFQDSFEKPTMANLTEYEGKFNAIKNNQTTYDRSFGILVTEFHAFDKYVRDTLDVMSRKAEECDIYLDLKILDLEEAKLNRTILPKDPNNPVDPLLPDFDNTTLVSS